MTSLGLALLGVALRKVLPVEPLPPEFVRLCEELDAADRA